MLSVSSSFSSLLLLLYDDDDDIQCVSSLSSVLLSISFLLQNANWIAFAISPSSAKDFGKDFLPLYRNLPTTVLIRVRSRSEYLRFVPQRNGAFFEII